METKLSPNDLSRNWYHLSLLVLRGGEAALRTILLDLLLTYVLKKEKDNVDKLKGKLLDHQFDSLYHTTRGCVSIETFDEVVLNFILMDVLKCNTSYYSCNNSKQLNMEIRDYLQNYVLGKHLLDKQFMLPNKEHFQKQRLFPSKNTVMNFNSMDISTLQFIIRHYFGVNPTSGDWVKEPKPSYVKMGDDILRLKRFRDTLAHTSLMELSDSEFNSTWQDVQTVLKRLLGAEFENQIKELKDIDTDKLKEVSDMIQDQYLKDMDTKREVRLLSLKIDALPQQLSLVINSESNQKDPENILQLSRDQTDQQHMARKSKCYWYSFCKKF